MVIQVLLIVNVHGLVQGIVHFVDETDVASVEASIVQPAC
jgi:hypothetical protein